MHYSKIRPVVTRPDG